MHLDSLWQSVSGMLEEFESHINLCQIHIDQVIIT